MSQRLALLVGNSEFGDTTLSRLVTPDADVATLAQALRDPGIGSFDHVNVFINESSMKIRREIGRFFSRKAREDLLVFYFSGHGVLDDRGRLYLATRDTTCEELRATAISARYITDEMDNSRSRRQVLILDCCHSGAFARGSKGIIGASVGTASAFEGTGFGRIVMTATDATQYAWEGDDVIGDAESSVFTHHLIEGLRTGNADIEGNGRISVDELFDYVYEKVVTQTPKQSPGKWSYMEQGEMIIARNPNPTSRLADLPPELHQDIESPIAEVRASTVHLLEKMADGSDRKLSLAAKSALNRLTKDDSRLVSTKASAILTRFSKQQQKKQVAELYEESIGLAGRSKWKQALAVIERIKSIDPEFNDKKGIEAAARAEIEAETGVPSPIAQEERQIHPPDRPASDGALASLAQPEITSPPPKFSMGAFQKFAIGGVIGASLIILGGLIWFLLGSGGLAEKSPTPPHPSATAVPVVIAITQVVPEPTETALPASPMPTSTNEQGLEAAISPEFAASIACEDLDEPRNYYLCSVSNHGASQVTLGLIFDPIKLTDTNDFQISVEMENQAQRHLPDEDGWISLGLFEPQKVKTFKLNMFCTSSKGCRRTEIHVQLVADDDLYLIESESGEIQLINVYIAPDATDERRPGRGPTSPDTPTPDPYPYP